MKKTKCLPSGGPNTPLRLEERGARGGRRGEMGRKGQWRTEVNEMTGVTRRGNKFKEGMENRRIQRGG